MAMGIFICEKCGRLDNTACGNNYWLAHMNKSRIHAGEQMKCHFKPEYSYFENHVCCSDCCEGVAYSDNSGTIRKRYYDIVEKEHWTKYGKEKLLEWETRGDGSMMNATEYFAGHEHEEENL